jgi:IS4 transposase
MIRKVVYIDPISGNQYSFITNVMDLAPGLIAYIYKVRWDIEKTFQQFKPKSCNPSFKL